MFGLQVFPYVTLAKVLAVGFAVGVIQLAVYWGFTWVANQVDNGEVESYVPLVMMMVSIVFAHFLGLVGLIRLQVLRPLLVVLAAIATTWGVWVWSEAMPWWGELLAIGLIMGLTYSFFAWLNRLLSFPLALILSVLTIVAARLVFISL